MNGTLYVWQHLTKQSLKIMRAPGIVRRIRRKHLDTHFTAWGDGGCRPRKERLCCSLNQLVTSVKTSASECSRCRLWAVSLGATTKRLLVTDRGCGRGVADLSTFSELTYPVCVEDMNTSNNVKHNLTARNHVRSVILGCLLQLV